MKKIYKKENRIQMGLRPNYTEWQYTMSLSGNFVVQPRERLEMEQRRNQR